jgi:hypothetical protein
MFSYLHLWLIAWNDSDAVPRSLSSKPLTSHGGSRKHLMFARSEMNRLALTEKLDEAQQGRPPIHTRRINLITDISKENS